MSTKSFFANVAHLNKRVLSNKLTNQSDDFAIWSVGDGEGRARGAKSGGMEIADFVNLRLSRPRNRVGVRGRDYERTEGRAFYELTKSETVQHYKQIAVMTADGNVYTGSQARNLIGLPDDNFSRVQVRPGQLGDNRLFIASTSSNRILVAGTSLLYRKQ
jgi:hypothetical protein